MTITVGLVGNPNSGKTTVFNALTGASQRVGNWPGVTVERKSGYFTLNKIRVEVVDLPGVYSLTMVSNTSSLDERIACEFILAHQADVIINILDASNLERNLYLTTQLLEMGVPVILAVNMMDVAIHRQLEIDLAQLSEQWGCPVLPLEANKSKGIEQLKQLISKTSFKASSFKGLLYPEKIQEAIQALTPLLVDIPQSIKADWLACRLLENDLFATQYRTPNILSVVKKYQQEIIAQHDEEADILIADARYQFIQKNVLACTKKPTKARQTWTAKIDKVVLNRVLGIPIFLLAMYLMFLFSINVGGAAQDFFDISSNVIFVEGLSYVLNALHLPNWLIAVLANGIGKGINTTVTFIPVIGAMFLFLALLEDSGYMTRAAFIVDRLMRALGLPGKSFVPMIVGFGCNVPAVMATRTLDNNRDRILTVMMSPFMSCGARLAIYAVFTAAFFPVGGQNVVFALYLIGIVMAMITGLLLRKTILKGEPAPLIMELPPYHVPHIKTVALLAFQRLKGFLFRAGKLIIPICIILGMLNALTIKGTITQADGDVQSLLSIVGQAVTPLFSPMGIRPDNWPATVGLLTGVLAKEVVIGTLNSLYSQMAHITATPLASFHFWPELKEALFSLPANFRQLGQALGNPILAQAPVHTLSQQVYGLMYNRFDGQIGAFAYLLFVLLYVPCISTTAVMMRELNARWALFSVAWSTGLAYGIAVSFYQLGTHARHPMTTFLWVSGICATFGAVVFIMRKLSPENSLTTGGQYEFT